MSTRNSFCRLIAPTLLLFAAVLFFGPRPVWAVKHDQLLIVVNKNVPEGVRLAQYYMQRRHVPSVNLITLDTTKKEEIGREEYENEIAVPVRRFLSRNDPRGKKFACLVLMYGMPLRIGPRHDLGDELRLLELRSQLPGLREKEERARGGQGQEARELKEDITRIEAEIARVGKARQGASVDSELALVMEKGHTLKGWLPNRYFVLFHGKDIAMPFRVLPVSRLDGPTGAIVRRMIDDSMFAEENGLAGKAYFDARWPDSGGKDKSPYKMYDHAIHNAARIVQQSGRLPVVLDEREALFAPGTAPNAALYCGWYSLGKYVDAFTWARGSVGFHVASAECTTLRTGTSTVWCKSMLEKGAAATLGPVAEPYLQSFPAPEAFFGCLVKGGSLIECYTISNPFWSWQQVLVGDPLYRPFRNILERRD